MNRSNSLIILVVIIALILVPSFTAFAQENDAGGSSFSIGNVIKFSLIAFGGSLMAIWQNRKKEDDTEDE